MARAFDRANDMRVVHTAGPVGTFTTPDLTLAAVISPYPYVFQNEIRSIVGLWLNPALDGSYQKGLIGIEQYNSQLIYQEQFNNALMTSLVFVDTDGWALVAVTKSGTAVIGYRYVLATGSFTSQSVTLDGPGSSSALGANGRYVVGAYNLTTTEKRFHGNIAAAAIWHRVLTPSEIMGLRSGLWSMKGPAFLTEYPNGRDNPSSARELSQNRMVLEQSTNTARAVLPDPPGFRFSPLNRRR